jgi:hypothetical protein
MRSSDGGGPLGNGANTWHITLGGIYADSTSGMTLQEVRALIEPIQPDRVVAASLGGLPTAAEHSAEPRKRQPFLSSRSGREPDLTGPVS